MTGSTEHEGRGAALLVIDVQQALFERGTPIYHAAELLHNIGLLIDKAHQAGTPVIFIQHVNQSFLAQDCDGWRLHPSLHPLPADLVLQKHHGSALQDTPLPQELQARGINTLVVVGLVTHGCVRATCEDAKTRGYRVILVEDGHSNYHKKADSVIREWNQTLSAEGIELLSTAAVEFAGLA